MVVEPEAQLGAGDPLGNVRMVSPNVVDVEETCGAHIRGVFAMKEKQPLIAFSSDVGSPDQPAEYRAGYPGGRLEEPQAI